MQHSKCAAFVLACSLTMFASVASAVVVDDASDTLHGAGCATTGAGPCSLRDAITFGNAHANTTIAFNLVGGGVHTITPASPLPAISNSTIIDGYTQPGTSFNTATLQNGTNAVLLIELDLTNNGSGGLVITGTDARIQGLVINRSGGPGITVSADNVEIHGNFIGTNPAGTAAGPGNAGDGVAVGASGTVVGGTGDPVRNLISGNGGAGVRVSGAGAVNAIVGSNLIGTNAAGTAALPNGAQGVVAAGQNHIIGGANGGNVISGNTSSGVLATSAIANITISANNIGANAAGTAPLGNGGDGIVVNSNDVDVGGSDPSLGNVIGGNALNGILLNGSNVRVFNNVIGRLPNGSASPNIGSGISIQPFAGDNTIGGFQEGNTITNNASKGIEILGAGLTGGVHNFITQNAIFNNGSLGIKLGSGTTPTPNDAGDADTGPNGLQNFPVITSASVAASTLTVGGTLNSLANDDFTIDVFSSAACDASGNGEGQTYLGTLNTTSDGSGNATFNGSLTIPPGQSVITTTATNSSLSTSEFSTCFTVAGALPTISINDVSLAEGNSGTTSFVFTVTISQTANATVNFATADGTATAGSDYTATSGTVTFTSGGPLTQTITVPVIGDTNVEPNETFFVNLSGAVGATIADAQGQGTIVNDDVSATPTITINDVSQNEGNSGTTNFVFTVTLSSTANATVNFATADGTATAGSDYVATSGTVTFTSGGPLTQTITVAVNGDTTVEPNETFFVNLSGAVGATIADNQGMGTIVNDDAAPTLSVSDAAVIEGNTGTTNLVFTVSISGAPTGNVTVNYASADNTAIAGSDYVAVSGTLTFTPAGPLTQTITVQVMGDTLVEGNETFFVNLSGAVGATIADALGIGTIIDDDGPPPVIPTLGPAQIVVLILLLGAVAGMSRRRMRER